MAPGYIVALIATSVGRFNSNSNFNSIKTESKIGPKTQLEQIDFLQFSLIVDCLRDSVPVWNSILERALSTISEYLLFL